MRIVMDVIVPWLLLGGPWLLCALVLYLGASLQDRKSGKGT